MPWFSRSAVQCDALEAVELAHGLLDASAAPVEGACEVLGGRSGVGLVRDDRDSTASSGGGSVSAAVVALVGDHGAGRAIRAKVEQGLEHRRVGLLAACDLEGDRMAVEIGRHARSGTEALRALQRRGAYPLGFDAHGPATAPLQGVRPDLLRGDRDSCGPHPTAGEAAAGPV